MNPSNTWKGKLEAASFLPFKYLDRQCVLLCPPGFENLTTSLVNANEHEVGLCELAHNYSLLNRK